VPKQENYVGIDSYLTGSRTHHNLGFIDRQLKRLKQAEEQWLLAIQETPQFEAPWLALVELYLEQKRHREIKELSERLAGKPYCNAILPALEARVTLSQGDAAGACQILEQALTIQPKAVWLRVFLSDILLRVVKDRDAAEKHMRMILKLSPNEEQTRRKLAELMGKNQSIQIAF
jgi:tetratricopeptide (TPR) repeat protein